jgi:caffeoyl-CoA O-methyltransferase
MDIINSRLNEYMTKLLPQRDEVLSDMEKFARQNRFPIVGPLAGNFLRQMALAINAKNIFEMGSGYGYSACWFAKGMPQDGKIICTDGSDDNRQKAEDYFKRAGIESKIEFVVGDAREIIQQYDGPFDIIFNDIDKVGYPQAFDLAISRLRKGGLFITDNVLWSGRILHKRQEESTRAIIEFNRKLFNSPGILSSIVPIRDGLGMAIKL